MALTKHDVFSALRSCRDPEIPINIVDLGLVYDVEIRSEQPEGPCDVRVTMTLTSPGCPMSQSISAEVHKTLLQLEQVRTAKVEIVWEPSWNPSMISEAGRKELHLA